MRFSSVLLVTNTLVSSLLYKTRAIIPKDVAVDPELASMIDLFAAEGLFNSMFNAAIELASVRHFIILYFMGKITRKCLDILSGKQGQHFGINANIIASEGVQFARQFDKRNRWLKIWIEVIFHRVRSFVHIECVGLSHGLQEK